MNTKRILMTVVIISALLLAGCGSRVGALQTETRSVELDNARSVHTEIDFGAGVLRVNGGAEKLLEADFTYNVAKLKPEVKYSNGTLVVQQPDVHGMPSLIGVTDFRNEWSLDLNKDVPMDLRVNLGAGTSELQLAELSLTGLNVSLGASNSTIDLRGDWTSDLDVTIDSGATNITLKLPQDRGVRVEVEAGPTLVNAPSLTKVGNVYTNDAYGASDVTLQIKIQSGIGQITLEEDQ